MSKPWSQSTRILVVIFGLIGLVWLVVVAKPLFQALIIAVLLAYLLVPIVELFARWMRVRRSTAARLVYALFMLVLATIPAVLSTVAWNQFSGAETELVEAVTELWRWLAQSVVIFGFSFQPSAMLDNVGQDVANSWAVLSGGALGAILTVTTNLLWGIAALVILYYLLVEGPKIKPGLVGLLPVDYQEEIRLLLDEIDQAWRIFLRAQLVIFVIFAALLTSGIYLVIWLYRSRLVSLSPIGLIVLLVVVYTVVQQVDNIWLRPYFFSGRLKLHPGVIFIGLIGAAALSGLLGVIVIVPGIATAKIVGRYVHRKLLGLPAWPHLASAETDEDQVEPETTGQAAVLANLPTGSEQTIPDPY